jgi:hypothetical protein
MGYIKGVKQLHPTQLIYLARRPRYLKWIYIWCHTYQPSNRCEIPGLQFKTKIEWNIELSSRWKTCPPNAPLPRFWRRTKCTLWCDLIIYYAKVYVQRLVFSKTHASLHGSTEPVALCCIRETTNKILPSDRVWACRQLIFLMTEQGILGVIW